MSLTKISSENRDDDVLEENKRVKSKESQQHDVLRVVDLTKVRVECTTISH